MFLWQIARQNLSHLFSSCNKVILLWIKIKLSFSKYIHLTLWPLQITTFGLAKGNDKSFLI